MMAAAHRRSISIATLHFIADCTLAYRSLNLGPGDVPFELMPSPGKGWGAFATRKLMPGDLIFEEKPLLVVRKPLRDVTDSDVLSELLQLPPPERQQFLDLRENGAAAYTSMAKAYKWNSFGLSVTPKLSVNIQEHGVFIVLSRINHSCIPNCTAPQYNSQKDKQQIYALKTIMAGEELTFCYHSTFQYWSAKDRAQILDFQCDCKACHIGISFQQASDMRRTLLRGLHYLTHGQDIDGPDRLSAGPVLSDPELRRAAAELRIPLSTRFIATVLRGFLLEEEGLMDRFQIGVLRTTIQDMGASFKTRGNAQIAAAVTAQRSWLGMVCTAFKLYGKEDEADQEIAAQLQSIRRVLVL